MEQNLQEKSFVIRKKSTNEFFVLIPEKFNSLINSKDVFTCEIVQNKDELTLIYHKELNNIQEQLSNDDLEKINNDEQGILSQIVLFPTEIDGIRDMLKEMVRKILNNAKYIIYKKIRMDIIILDFVHKLYDAIIYLNKKQIEKNESIEKFVTYMLNIQGIDLLQYKNIESSLLKYIQHNEKKSISKNEINKEELPSNSLSPNEVIQSNMSLKQLKQTIIDLDIKGIKQQILLLIHERNDINGTSLKYIIQKYNKKYSEQEIEQHIQSLINNYHILYQIEGKNRYKFY
ncbi:MAG: hypothetical protein WC934_01950 [Acidithiobacillus sp.]|jgi:hypothetical protein|uniref:hypothetical protein n=1 Tax=Acidithiobacillus sp. TaxID=1872118 RepID=UPI0035607D2D